MDKIRIRNILLRRMWIITLSLFSVYSLVLYPLYIKVETDIAFMLPVIVDIIPYILDICELAGISLMYAYTIISMRYFDGGALLPFRISFSFLILIKYLLQLPVIVLFGNPLPTLNDFLTSLLLPFILELILYTVINLITHSVISKANCFIEEKAKLVESVPSLKFDPESVYFPFVKLFNNENPYQRSAFLSAVVISVSKMLQLLYIDILSGFASDLSDLIWIIISYISCAVLGLLGYLVMITAIMNFHKI